MRRSVQQAQATLPAAAMRAVFKPTHGARDRPPAAARRQLDDDVPSDTRLVSRAEGYYWLAEGDREVGPFASIEAAMADMGHRGDADVDDIDDTLASGQALAEVEDELGMSSWIDPDTGALAEATWTRLEDH